MKMERTMLVALLALQLLIIPSKAYTGMAARGWNNPFGTGFGVGPEGNGNQALPAGDQGVAAPKEGGEDAKAGGVVTNKGENLKVGFYDQSCPNAENIVSDWLKGLTQTNPNAMANLIRLAFHDCFVGGCDASILLDSVPTGDKVEKSSYFNGMLLKGADLIDDLKAKLEEDCPQTVSCSDTLAFAANEAMAVAGGVRQRPLGGRRDSLVSLASLADDNNLALPTWTLKQMIALFKRKGFSTEEMVILLGAHSVGASHCDMFMDRVYNYKNTQKPDPRYPAPVVEELKQACPNPGTPQFRNPTVNFDETPYTLDNRFFRDLVERNRSLLMTDSYLAYDRRTKAYVKQMVDDPQLFPRRFAEIFTKLLSLNVITGTDGEVRNTCRSTN